MSNPNINTTTLDARYATKPRIGNRAAGVGEIIINADDYGVARDGVTDDTAALDAAFAAVAAVSASTGGFGAKAVLYLRAGRYIDSGTRFFSTRIIIRGEGAFNTILYRKDGSTGDYLTFNNQYSGIEGITVDGNRVNCPSSGDTVVLNAYRTFARESYIRNAKGNAVTVGKAAQSIAYRLEDLFIGQSTGYGIQVTSTFSNTDGIIRDIDLGQCGLSGIRLSTGAQSLSLVHSWGNGLESSTDNHGIWIDSNSNMLVGCQSETNNGHGIYVSGSTVTGNTITGAKLWGNVKAGLCILDATLGSVHGGTIFRNGCGNTAHVGTDVNYAAIQNNGTEWTFSGINVWDDTGAVSAGSYVDSATNPGNTGYTPTFAFPGRASGSMYQSYAYAETSGATSNTISGCNMPRTRTLNGNNPYLITALYNRMNATVNNYGLPTTTPTQNPSSGSVRFPAESDFIQVTVSSTAITAFAGGWAGRRCTVMFTGTTPGTITNSTTLQLAGGVDWTPGTGALLSLIYDGANWRETSRKA